MADIDSDEHRPHAGHFVRQLQVEKVASHLAVELLDDVRGLGKVEFGAVASSDDLRRDLIQLKELFVLIVELLIAENEDKHFGEA